MSIPARYITLDRRPDRRISFLSRYPTLAFPSLIRFRAIDGRGMGKPAGFAGSEGGYACCQSHRAVMQSAIDADIPRIAIFEDDCLFSADFATRLPELLSRSADILYLGGVHKKTNHNDWRETGVGGSWAYVVNRKAMVRILAEPVKYDWDRVLSRCLPDLTFHLAEPRVCGHAAGVADNEPGRIFTSEIW